MYFLPLLCMQCNNPPCVKVCPTGASHKRDDGIVLMNYDRCIGCRYCEVACPYDARCYVKEIKPYYGDQGFTPYENEMGKDHQTGVQEKCTFCAELVDKGEVPTCVAVCPAYARYFGDLDDPTSEINVLIKSRFGEQLHPEIGTDPAVFYIKMQAH